MRSPGDLQQLHQRLLCSLVSQLPKRRVRLTADAPFGISKCRVDQDEGRRGISEIPECLGSPESTTTVVFMGTTSAEKDLDVAYYGPWILELPDGPCGQPASTPLHQ